MFSIKGMTRVCSLPVRASDNAFPQKVERSAPIPRNPRGGYFAKYTARSTSSAVRIWGTRIPSAPRSNTRLMTPCSISWTRTRQATSLRLAARECSTTSLKSRWPCSVSMQIQSRPNRRAISVIEGDSSVTQRPRATSPFFNFCFNFCPAVAGWVMGCH